MGTATRRKPHRSLRFHGEHTHERLRVKFYVSYVEQGVSDMGEGWWWWYVNDKGNVVKAGPFPHDADAYQAALCTN